MDRDTHLNGLAMLTEDVDPHHRTLPLGVGALHNVVVEVLLPSHLVDALEDKLEERLQVLGARTGDEDVRVAVENSEGDRQSEGGRLSTSTTGGEGDGLRKTLGGDGVGESENGLGLVERARLGDNLPDSLGVLQSLLERPQLGLAFCLAPLSLSGRAAYSDSSIGVERDDILARRDGQDVELIVDDEARRVVTEGQEETLVETSDGGGGGGGGTVARVNVLRKGGSACGRRKATGAATYHSHGVQSAKTLHALEETNDDSSSLDRFNSPGEQVGGDGLKVLKDEHVEGLSEDFVGVLVVAGGSTMSVIVLCESCQAALTYTAHRSRSQRARRDPSRRPRAGCA